MSPKIAVRLPNWLGDTVMAVPAVRAVRAAQPEARLLLAGPWATLLAAQGLADVLVTYPRSWRGRLRTADVVREFAPEAALLLPNSFEAAASAWYWRADRRIGFAVGARSPLLTDPVPFPAPRRHQIDEYLALLAPLGIAPAGSVPRLSAPAPDSEERRAVRALLTEVGARAEAGRRRVGVHLGAAHGPAKVWPAERIIEFCRLTGGEGLLPVLLGSSDDIAFAEEVGRATRAPSLVGRDRPALLTAVLSEVDALVSGDTGVAHLAASLGTPVVALFGPTDPALTAPRGRTAVLQHPMPCAPCFYRECPIEHPCLRSIGAGEVRDRVWRLLGEDA